MNKRYKILANLFKTLSDPHRIMIINILYHTNGHLTCREIDKKLSLSKSTMSYHFKALRNANLINERKAGQVKYLSVNRKTFNIYLPGFLESL